MAQEGARTGGQQDQQPAPSMGIFLPMMVMMFMMFILMNPEVRNLAGSTMSPILFPLIGFDALYPVLTVFCASIIMVLFSTTIRHFLTNWTSAGRHAVWSKYVNEQMKKARESGNPQAMKRVNELNLEIMKLSGDRMNSQMKSMVFTMVFAILIFMWLSVFMYYNTVILTVTTPWDLSWGLRDPGPLLHVFPQWVLLYSLFSIPFGQVIGGVLKLLTFDRRIARLEKEEAEMRIIKRAEKKAEKEKKARQFDGDEEEKGEKDEKDEDGEPTVAEDEDDDLDIEEDEELEVVGDEEEED